MKIMLATGGYQTDQARQKYLLPVEIVMVARDGIMHCSMKLAFAEAALARRGWSPFNRATLDMPEILETATEEVKKERDIVLRSRGINNPLAVPPPPTQRDLLTTGSGRLAGGAAAADELQECSAELNYTGFTTTKVMTLAHNNSSKHEGRRNNMGADTSMERRLSPEILRE